jgi:hypothetical protein
MMLSIESAFGVEARLRQLIARGFRFVHPRDDQGEIVTIVGFRAHDDVIDVIRLHSEDHVVATRIPGDEDDLLTPTTVLWESTGPMRQVLDDLLDLPDDRSVPCSRA